MIGYKNIFTLIWFKLTRKNKDNEEFQDLAHHIHLQALETKNIGQGAFIADRGESNLFKHITLSKDPIVFDVGANKGQYSELLLKSLIPAIIYAFEPVHTVADIFETKITSEKVHLIRKGLGETEGSLIIYKDPSNDLLSSVYKRDLSQTNFDLSSEEEIEITTLDKFCQLNKIDKIDYLKLDVEGHEMSALKGSIEMLRAGRINHIQFEFGGCNLDSRTNLRDFFNLLSNQYKIFRILEDGIIEVNYDASHEVYNTTNFIAILK
ncbi:MAG: FkbM family methyltransferase [Arenicella sp.]|jgi:FkbM family methyltransferase